MARKSTEWLFRWDPSAGAQLGPLLRHWYEYCSAGIAGVSQNETTDSGHSKLARWLVGEVDASELGAIHRVRLRGPGAILEVHVVLEADPHEPGAIIGRPVDAGNLPYWSSAIIASDLLQELPDPIVVVDEQDRIVYVNQPGADLSGMLAQELLGKPVSVFRSLTAKPADPLAEGFSPASGFHFDLPLVSKDGRYLLLKVRPVDLGDRSYRVGVACDVTRLWEYFLMLDTVRQVASAASVALDPGAMVEALARGLRSVISVAELCLIVVEGTLARVVGVASWQGDRLSVHSGAESVVLIQELRTTLASGQPTAVDLGALGDLALHFEQAEGHLVSIPLTRESKALGGLLVRILGEEPSPEKLAILGHLSEPVGVFTMHVLTNLRLRERLAMHRAMLDLVTSTTSGLPSAEMLSAALDKAKDLLLAKGVGVALLVPARHSLKVVAAHGALSFALGSELPITPDMDAGIFRAGTMWMAEQAGTLWSEGLSGPAAALPCVALPLRTGGRVLGVLFVVPKARGKPDTGMMALMEAVASLVANALFRSSLEHDAEESYLRTVIMLQRMLDARDSYVATHSGIVADVAEALGRQLKLDDLSLKELRLAALLHDIGKVAVPDSILKKAGPLTPDEWDLVREHPLVGERILSPLRKLGRVAQYVRHHHERWDGTGYPDGLRGEAIPLASRIIAVVDAFFAIVSERSYRPGRSLPDALAELEAGSGTQFDPKVVWAFLRLVRSGQLDIVALVKAHKAAQPPRVR